MITNIGFTKGAENRIKGYHRDIRLNVVEYQNLDDYHFEWDMCDYCDDEESFSKGVIVWNSKEELIKGKIIRNIEKGDCSKCGNEYLRCLDCGEIHLIDLSDIQCGCGNIYAVRHDFIGQGMTESRIILKSVEK